MKVLLVLEPIILLGLVVYGWGPDCRTWVPCRTRSGHWWVRDVVLGAALGVPEARAAHEVRTRCRFDSS